MPKIVPSPAFWPNIITRTQSAPWGATAKSRTVAQIVSQKRNMISQQIQDRVAEETGDSLKKEVETIFEGEEV